MRLFMVVVFVVGLFLLFIGYSRIYDVAVSNWSDLFNAEKQTATVTKVDKCINLGASSRRSTDLFYEQTFQLKMIGTDENIHVIGFKCGEHQVGDEVEVVKAGINPSGVTTWVFKDRGFAGDDLFFGPFLFLFGLSAVYFGFKRVVFGFGPNKNAKKP